MLLESIPLQHLLIDDSSCLDPTTSVDANNSPRNTRQKRVLKNHILICCSHYNVWTIVCTLRFVDYQSVEVEVGLIGDNDGKIKSQGRTPRHPSNASDSVSVQRGADSRRMDIVVTLS